MKFWSRLCVYVRCHYTAITLLPPSFAHPSYSQMWMSPWGYTYSYPVDYDTQDALSRKCAAALERVNGVRYETGTSANTIYASSGGAEDYTYGVAGILYSFCVELRDTGRYGFLLPADQIEPSGRETFDAVKVMAEHLINNPRRA